MSKEYLALDLGATSGRGVVGRFDGRKLQLCETYRFPNGCLQEGGSYLWDVEKLFEGVIQAISRSVSEYAGICSVGVDSWGVDCGYIGWDGHLLRKPYSYRDPRVNDTPEKLHARLSWEHYYAITGIQRIASNTIYQLFEDLSGDPRRLAETSQFLMIPDLIHYLLCGERVGEYTILSTGGFLAVNEREYSEELLTAAKLPRRIFPDMVMPGNRLGKLSGSVALRIGADRLQIINVAEHDTASAVLTLPAGDADSVYISCGTWALMGICSDLPILTESARKANFTNEGGGLGGIRFLKNLAGLGLITAARREWEKQGRSYSYGDIALLARSEKPFQHLIDPNDDRFTAPQSLSGAIAAYCIESVQSVPRTDGEIIRCLYDSITLSFRLCLEQLEEVTGRSFSRIRILGGGVQDTVLCSLTADVTGRTVMTGAVEASSAGNILMQALADGELSADDFGGIMEASFPVKEYFPDPSRREEIDEAYERYLGYRI